jgi:uncharacterized protein with HEPN domain
MTYPAVVELIAHLHDAAQDAIAFIEGMTLADFIADKRTHQAVVMNLIIVGEIATRIMDRHAEFAHAHPHIPWQGMRGMRNRIAHGYFEIDLTIVWETITQAIPELLRNLPPHSSSSVLEAAE